MYQCYTIFHFIHSEIQLYFIMNPSNLTYFIWLNLVLNMSMIMASIPIVSQLLQESALCNGDSVHKANYTEHDRFNNTFSENNNLSILHLNIRSVPLHFSEFLCYLGTLDI